MPLPLTIGTSVVLERPELSTRPLLTPFACAAKSESRPYATLGTPYVSKSSSDTAGAERRA
jgi:hypothetical protein